MNTAIDFFSPKSRKIRRIEKSMQKAESYDEWLEIARSLDDVNGTTFWKNVDQTNLYDFNSIRTRIDKLRSLRANRDDHGLLFALNEGIHGNMGGMGKPVLHTRAMVGTKKLIEDYVQEISHSLQHLADLDSSVIPDEEKHDFFQRASHCYGRSALLAGFAHQGSAPLNPFQPD